MCGESVVISEVIIKKDKIMIYRILLLVLCWIHGANSNCTIHHQHITCIKHILIQDIPIDNKIKLIELRNIEMEKLDLARLLILFPDTENVSIYGGNIQKIGPPNPNNKIRVLQMVHIGVVNIGNWFLGKFPQLETLNLEGNYLQTWARNLEPPKLKNLYLAGNRWDCSLDLDWALDQTIIKDIQNLTCYGEPHAKKSLLTIAHFVHEIKNQCPKSCTCTLPKVIFTTIESDQLEPVVEVNCSYRGLTELPVDLLPKTRIIHLEGNEIEDLKPIKQNPVYKKALELYLDNNKVKSIEELEGTYFLKHFRVFSLSGNKLPEIPTYAMDNALSQNENMPEALRLSLGGNPWRCDCVFTPVFQEMLQKFRDQIVDIDEVKCSYVEGDENSLLPIIELSRSSVCRSPTEYSVQALDLLNVVLASLILLILGKLAYDYYYFKRTGRLPWIVTKMP